MYSPRRGWEYQYQHIAILMDEPIQSGQEILLWLKFHMPPNVIQKSEPAYVWSFVVNPQIDYAVEPCSGHYLWVLYGELSAPCDLTITYLVDNHSCVPDIRILYKEKNLSLTITKASIPTSWHLLLLLTSNVVKQKIVLTLNFTSILGSPWTKIYLIIYSRSFSSFTRPLAITVQIHTNSVR
jgi:hypothetical protein